MFRSIILSDWFPGQYCMKRKAVPEAPILFAIFLILSFWFSSMIEWFAKVKNSRESVNKSQWLPRFSSSFWFWAVFFLLFGHVQTIVWNFEIFLLFLAYWNPAEDDWAQVALTSVQHCTKSGCRWEIFLFFFCLSTEISCFTKGNAQHYTAWLLCRAFCQRNADR